MPIRFLETLFWLGFYAAFLVFLFGYANGSPAYRAVFIERTASDFLPGATRDYMPPTPIIGGELAGYFTGSWWYPEDGARWGKGNRNVLRLVTTRALPVGSRITGRIGAMIGGTQTIQSVRIEVDRVEVERLEFHTKDETRTFDLLLPKPIGARDEVEIAFVMQTVKSPALMRIGTDPRELGVRFYELALVPPGNP